jgi:hypothetical protein
MAVKRESSTLIISSAVIFDSYCTSNPHKTLARLWQEA